MTDETLHAVYRIARNMCSTSAEAEEVTRHAVLSACREITSRPIEGSFRTWLYGMAMKVALAKRQPVRRGGANPLESLPHADGRLASRGEQWPSALARLRQMELTGLLREALDFLDDDVRAAFVLCDLVDLPAEEAAAILKTSPERVRQNAHRARLLLQGFLLNL
jgi:RNA polymerase sigma-70 factor (ECF subfamily)